MKKIIAVLILGFLIPLIGILSASNCELSTNECLLQKENIMPDFHWHSNVIKYTATHWELPLEVESTTDGGPTGDNITGMAKGVFHSPIYYYMAAVIYKLTNSFLALHIFSIFLMLITNILFLFFLKEFSNNKTFILFSLILFVFLPIQLFTSLIIHPSVIYPPLLILSLLLYIRATKNPTLKNYIFLGMGTGILTLADLKGFVFPLALGFFNLHYLIKKRYRKFKLLTASLIITTLIGSYTFIRNYLQFGSPLGFWKTSQGYIYSHEFSRLLSFFPAFWGGIYGGNELIKPLLSILVIILTLITVYSIIKNRKLDELVLMGFLTIILAFFMTCNVEHLISSFSCIGEIVHGRYLVIFNPSIAVFSSLVLTKRNKIGLLFILLISILFSIDFLAALN